MLNTPRINPYQPQPGGMRPRFSGATPWTVSTLDKGLRFIQKDRTREMLFADFMGFGVLRVAIDLFRQFFFSNKEANQPTLNVPAARERLIREVGSIFTDNVSGGLIAFGLTWLINRFGNRTPNIANQFASDNTLRLFQSLAEKSPNASAFIGNLASQMAPGQTRKVLPLLRQGLRPDRTGQFTEGALKMVQQLNPKKRSLDVRVGKQIFALDALLEDTSKFLKFMRQKGGAAGGGWQKRAQAILLETEKVNTLRLPVSLGLAMAMTFAIPYLNRIVTRKVDGLESYPGELGLKKMQTVEETSKNRSWFDRLCPYLGERLKKGDILPTLLSLVPLPFAFGMFDTEKLSAGHLRASFNNPLKKGFLKRVASMMQFGKGFPFTTEQQMASCFAFLIFSRMTSSRSDIEFRERLVDSFLGWSVWILATPFIKKLFAQRFDPNLLKKVGGETVFKRRPEIERLLPKAIRQKTLNRFILMSAASLGITIAILGIIEPLIAIKWTERQSRKATNA